MKRSLWRFNRSRGFMLCLAAVFALQLAFSQHVQAAIGGIKVTNVRGTQFTVTWTSDIAEVGSVMYTATPADNESWLTAYDDRGMAVASQLHHVTVKGLTPYFETPKANDSSGTLLDVDGTPLTVADNDDDIVWEVGVDVTYYYKIISGATTDDNNGSNYTINPGPAIVQAGSCLVAGKVFSDDGKTQMANDSIVYVTIKGSPDSATESTLLTSATTGYWSMDLVNFRTADLNDVYYDLAAAKAATNDSCGGKTLSIKAISANDSTATLTTTATDFAGDNTLDDMVVKIMTWNLDIDGNGYAGALSDGLLIIRYLFGLNQGASLISGAVDPSGTRTTDVDIAAYIATLLPPQ